MKELIHIDGNNKSAIITDCLSDSVLF